MKKLWFKNKTYGYGWTPASWEGWLSLFVYIVLLTIIVLNADQNSHSGSDTIYGSLIPVVLLTGLFLLLCYKKGEKLKWRWGKGK